MLAYDAEAVISIFHNFNHFGTWNISNLSNARPLIDDLNGVDTIKTWSLIITMLGDLGSKSAASMSGKEINSILGHIGIKSEATRVALHRLKKDGWLDTTKVGREVIYQLSENGLEQTSAAYEDVYREGIKHPDGWQLTLHPPNDSVSEVQNSNGIALLKSVYLVPRDEQMASVQCVEMDFDKNTIPSWFENRLVPAKMIEVIKRLNMLAENYLAGPELSNELDSAAVRLLFLHHWRKMALRESTWAHMWLCPDGPIANYHQQVFEILKLLSKHRS